MEGGGAPLSSVSAPPFDSGASRVIGISCVNASMIKLKMLETFTRNDYESMAIGKCSYFLFFVLFC